MSCDNTGNIPPQTPLVLDIPEGFPIPDIPEDNELTVERVALGKMLFYDPTLSLDSTFSCASCHLQEKGFADANPVSIGIKDRIGFRNVPTLANVAYHPYFFREGGNPALETQLLGPICAFEEMGFNAAELAERIKDHPTYTPLAQTLYDRPTMDLFTLSRSIASFERTLISGNSPFDQYYYQGNSDALTPQQIRGWQLFSSERTQCSSCHTGFDFSDYGFYNNGLYETYADEGRQRVTLADEDIGKFKVPTLRNIAQTAPYMHDGSLPTLEAVIAHYNQGGSNHPNKSPLISPLQLDEQEQKDLVAFLHMLTDTNFIENPAFAP